MMNYASPPRGGPGSMLLPWTPKSAPRYLACSIVPSRPYPMPPDEVLIAHDGGPSPESALQHARAGGGRYWVFTLERHMVTEAPWPAAEPQTARRYAIRRGRFVVLVPSPTVVPYGTPTEPYLVARVAAVASGEEEAQEAALALGMRAFVGRVLAIVECDGGWEIQAIAKDGARIGPEY